MNQMNLNERVLPHGESICFVGKFGLIFSLLGAVSAILNKTNEIHALSCTLLFFYALGVQRKRKTKATNAAS